MSEKLIDELREAAGQHPLDAPMSLFARAADALEKLALRDFSVPAGILERIEAALKRIENGHGLRRIPADPTDVDLVLAECRAFFEGAWPPFWLEKKTGEASGDKASGSDGINISDAPADFKRPESPPPAPPSKEVAQGHACSTCDEPATVTIPAEPPRALLMSMALRLDHGLGCPGYYDTALLGGQPGVHALRIEAAMRDMGKVYEEVVGRGFYCEKRAEWYLGLAGEKGVND